MTVTVVYAKYSSYVDKTLCKNLVKTTAVSEYCKEDRNYQKYQNWVGNMGDDIGKGVSVMGTGVLHQ